MKSTYENNKINVFIRTINPATINYTNFHSELIYIDIDNNNSCNHSIFRLDTHVP